MKTLLIVISFLCINGLVAQNQKKRLDLDVIDYVQILFKDSIEVHVMLWDDFTFEYDENHSEISIREGGSDKKYTYKAKNIEFVQFRNSDQTVTYNRYKSPKGREHLLLSEVHVNGDYSIVQSPSFVSPIFYYICYQGEVFSLIPTVNNDFLDFFACDEVNEKYRSEGNKILTLEDMSARLDLYLKHCLTPDSREEKKAEKLERKEQKKLSKAQ